MDALAFLAKVPLFSGVLKEAQLAFLAKESRPAFFRAGTRLMRQGDFGGAMFAITEGDGGATFFEPDGPGQVGGMPGLRGRAGGVWHFIRERLATQLADLRQGAC